MKRKILHFFSSVISSLLIFLLPMFSLIYNYDFHVLLSKYFSNVQNKFILRHIVRYFRGEISINNVFFTEQAIKHLQDVKILIIRLQVFIFILFVLLIILIIIYERHRIKFPMRKTSMFSFSIIGFFILFLLTFKKSFYYFHKLFFSNKLWLFSNDALLVNLYTQDFFKWFLTISLSISFIITIILFIFSKENSK